MDEQTEKMVPASEVLPLVRLLGHFLPKVPAVAPALVSAFDRAAVAVGHETVIECMERRVTS